MRIEKEKLEQAARSYGKLVEIGVAIFGNEKTEDWTYKGTTDKSYVFESPRLGVLRFSKARVEMRPAEGGGAFPIVEQGFGEFVVKAAEEEKKQ